jgi:hypothetical protein
LTSLWPYPRRLPDLNIVFCCDFFTLDFSPSTFYPRLLTVDFLPSTFYPRLFTPTLDFLPSPSTFYSRPRHLTLDTRPIDKLRILMLPPVFEKAYFETRTGLGLYNKHTCREVSPGLDAPRVAGSFPNSPSERGASNPGLTEPASMFGFYHMPFR